MALDRTAESERWRTEGLRVAENWRRYLASVDSPDGPDENGPGEDPREDERLAKRVLGWLREANQQGNVEAFRNECPPCMIPMISLLQANGQTVAPLVWLEDGRVAATIGSSYQGNRHVVAIGNERVDVLDGVHMVGRSPDRRYRAVAREDGIDIEATWGDPLRHIPWPSEAAMQLGRSTDAMTADEMHLEEMHAFPDGQRVLIVTGREVAVLAADGGVTPLLRHVYQLIRGDEAGSASGSDDEFRTPHADMAHAAISPDGRLIAIGAQDTEHHVLDATTFELLANVPTASSYPHAACFSADGKVVAFNSCHFYGGGTLAVDIADLPAFAPSAGTDHSGRMQLTREIDRFNRVYCMLAHRDEFLYGDAHGVLNCASADGSRHWRHFLGSSFSSMDFSPDGRRLAVSTYAGQVVFFDMEATTPDPFACGNAPFRETHRWLFWKTEKQPLRW
ncbi:MAG: WD40 repeat domain-containing protein [Planctomycetota bacterium]